MTHIQNSSSLLLSHGTTVYDGLFCFIDSKRVGIKVPCDDGNDEREDREDELPTVVVLRHGDVGQEEFLDYRQKTKDQGEPLL